MPVILLERLPLPSFEAYAAISASLLGCSLYYASEITIDQEWKTQLTDTDELQEEFSGALQNILPLSWLNTRAQDVATFLIYDPLCLWTVLNMVYCIMFLFGSWLQKQVFGQLRISELQHMKDKFWNFVFYKFIFIFGIINVQSMLGVILWCSWFSVIGFLHIHTQLCQDRFEYLSTTPCNGRQQHLKLLSLLGSILFICGLLFVLCFMVAQRGDWITFALLLPECCLITLRTIHIITKYLLYLRAFHAISQLSQGWSSASYYNEFIVEVSSLFLDMAHHIHMLLRANMLLSMASLVIFMQLRVLYAQLVGRLRRHRNYMRILNLVKSICPLEELDNLKSNDEDDNQCAICWENAAVARRLPCSHLFHHNCLLQWLEQDPSCPTCRRQLLTTKSDNSGSQERQTRDNPGGGWVSWSWTGWTRLLNHSIDIPAAENSQLESLAEQVHQLFPNYTITALIEDLRRTRSVDLTVENILVGRLTATPMFHQEASSLTTASSSEETFEQDLTDAAAAAAAAAAAISAEPVKFVEDPQERQQILKCRKRDLMAEARNRFLQKQAKERLCPS